MQSQETSFLQAASLLEEIKKKHKDEPNFFAITYVTLCKALEGYISTKDFLNMGVLEVVEIMDAVTYINKELKRDQRERELEAKRSRRRGARKWR